MAKKDTVKRIVHLGVSDLTRDTRIALMSIVDIMNGLTIKELIEAAEIVRDECGDDAIVDVVHDCNWGSSDADISWDRLETDSEVQKRTKVVTKRRK